MLVFSKNFFAPMRNVHVVSWTSVIALVPP